MVGAKDMVSLLHSLPRCAKVGSLLVCRRVVFAVLGLLLLLLALRSLARGRWVCAILE